MIPAAGDILLETSEYFVLYYMTVHCKCLQGFTGAL